MTVEGILHLDGGDVLATGDDDVLAAVADFHVAIGVPHGQIAGMEPAAIESLGRGAGVLQVALHHQIAAHHDLAEGLAVLGHRLQGVRVGHHQAVEQQLAHTLTGLQAGTLLGRRRIPLVLPGTDHAGAVGFGQAVDVGDAEIQRLHGLDHRRGRRRAGGHRLDRAGLQRLQLVTGIGQHVQHDGRAAEMIDAMLGQRRVDGLGAHVTQRHAGADRRGQRPGETPAVAVEHRQGPQVHRETAHLPADHVGQRVQVRATVVVDHALGIAGGAGGVVQGDGLPLVLRQAPGRLGIAFGEQLLVFQLADQLALGIGRIVDADQQRRLGHVAGGAQRQLAELLVHQQHAGLAVLQDETDGFGIQTGVDGIEHRAAHGHAKVRLEHRRAVGRQNRHGIAQTDAPRRQRRTQPATARIGLPPGLSQRPVDQSQTFRIDGAGALEKGQRAERLKVRGHRRHAEFIGVVGGHHGLSDAVSAQRATLAKACRSGCTTLVAGVTLQSRTASG